MCQCVIASQIVSKIDIVAFYSKKSKKENFFLIYFIISEIYINFASN